MKTAIEEIVRFNTDRKLEKNKYDVLNAHANIIEELMESIGLDVPKKNREKLKREIEVFVTNLKQNDIIEQKYRDATETPEPEIADAYCDVIVFAIGELLKLGLNPELALLETAKEINSRTGKMENGKFEKDLSNGAKSNWYKADYNKCKLGE